MADSILGLIFGGDNKLLKYLVWDLKLLTEDLDY